MIHKIHVIAKYASLHLLDLPQVYLWSMIEDSFSVGHLETVLNTRVDIFFSMLRGL